jgi:hypothetical protein
VCGSHKSPPFKESWEAGKFYESVPEPACGKIGKSAWEWNLAYEGNCRNTDRRLRSGQTSLRL